MDCTLNQGKRKCKQIDEKYIKNGLITERFHPDDHDLKIYNYTAKTQYKRLWDDTTRLTRGLIVKNGFIVAMPWKKFWNLNEVPETSIENLPDESPEITTKIDGALNILYKSPDGKLALTTRGSFESDEAIWGTEYFRKHYTLPLDIVNRYTIMFEVVSPVMEHVLDYRDDLYLIGLRDMWDRRKLLPYSKVIKFGKEYNLSIYPTFMVNTPLDLLPLGASDIEGWVAMYPKAQLLVKIKTTRYREAHRFLQATTYNNVLDLLEGNTYDDVVSGMPVEVRDKAVSIQKDLLERYNEIEGQVYRYYDRLPSGDRKTKAIWITENVPLEYRGLVFCLLSGKKPFIWKVIRKEIKILGEENGSKNQGK